MEPTNKKLFEILNSIELEIEESEKNYRISFSDLGVCFYLLLFYYS